MKSLSFSTWNIQGLNSSVFGLKSRHSDFMKELQDLDVIILQETWCRGDAFTSCPSGYREIILPSVKLSSVTQGRDSGGMIIWIKSELPIELIKKEQHHLWLKIQKGMISASKPVFLCAVYIPPLESPYFQEETFQNIEREISHFQAQGNVLLMGDLNARTGAELDFIESHGSRFITGNNHLYPSHPSRQNCDETVNAHGRQLLQLCRGLALYIVNGRLRGDSLGRYTYSSALGNSTVDYTITDLDLSSLRAFTVKPLKPFSDHSQIILYIKQSETSPQTIRTPYQMSKIMSFKWTETSASNYSTAVDSSEIQSLIHSFQIQEYPKNQFGINQEVQDLNNIFYKTAQKSNLAIVKPKKKYLDTDKWFDLDCKALRKNLRNLSNQKHRQPDNPDLRLLYCEALKQYKATLRRKKAQFLQSQFEEIEKSINSHKFWDKWKLLYKPNQEVLAIQDGEKWKNHFQELYTPTEIQNSNQNEIINKLDNLERSIKTNQNPLDFPITMKELEEKLGVLESRKACGVDSILNEMLKHTDQSFRLAMLKLFNDVLCVGFFPEIWNKGLISPIHKSGDKLDPNNYRGICVNSNLGKVLCSILNARLLHFLMKHNALSKSQIGFLPKCRTSDHIFTLQTLIDKYVHQNKEQIFACFVDFKKAFDSIWHEGLYLKLIDSGVGGKFYDLIKSMYTASQCAVKIGNQRTEFFPQGRGVRQGCSLSPTLFNIYINQLANMLEHAPFQGLTLHDTEIKCLLYADDLVLLSPTKEGLQDGLDLLEDYCQSWALTVNLQKTRVMMFQKRSRSQGPTHTFTLSHRTIESTKAYTYLGLKITPTGNFTLAVNELKEKAQRAFYAIKRSIKIDIPIQIWLKLFKSIIEPIVLYGSEVWGPSIKFDFFKLGKTSD